METLCPPYTKALSAFKNIENANDEKFLSLYNLSVNNDRLANFKTSKSLLNRSLQYAHKDKHLSLTHRALACRLSQDKNYTQAMWHLDKAFYHDSESSPVDRSALKTVAIDIYIRANKLNIAKLLVNELLNDKLTREKPRIIFYKHLIEQLLDTEYKWPKASNTILKSNEYTLKWQILESLQSGQKDKSLQAWGKLQELFPQIYEENFEYKIKNENLSAFGRVLNLYKTPPISKSLILSTPLGPHTEKLWSILKNSNFPIRKENLIEYIWDTKYSPEYDDKFYKLIQRLKSKTSAHIRSFRGTYQIRC